MNDKVKVSCDCGWSRSWNSRETAWNTVERAIKRHRYSVRCAEYAVRMIQQGEEVLNRVARYGARREER